MCHFSPKGTVWHRPVIWGTAPNTSDFLKRYWISWTLETHSVKNMRCFTSAKTSQLLVSLSLRSIWGEVTGDNKSLSAQTAQVCYPYKGRTGLNVHHKETMVKKKKQNHQNRKIQASSKCWLQKWLYCSFNMLFLKPAFATSLAFYIESNELYWKGESDPTFCATTTKKNTQVGSSFPFQNQIRGKWLKRKKITSVQYF